MSWGQEGRLVLPSVIEEGAVSLLSNEGLGQLGGHDVWHLWIASFHSDMEIHLCFL